MRTVGGSVGASSGGDEHREALVEYCHVVATRTRLTKTGRLLAVAGDASARGAAAARPAPVRSTLAPAARSQLAPATRRQRLNVSSASW